MPDALAHYACLADFDLYAGDGQFIAAACHDLPAPRGKSAAGAAVNSATDPATAESLPTRPWAPQRE